MESRANLSDAAPPRFSAPCARTPCRRDSPARRLGRVGGAHEVSAAGCRRVSCSMSARGASSASMELGADVRTRRRWDARGWVSGPASHQRLRKRAENVPSPFPTTTTDSTRRAAPSRTAHSTRVRRAPIVRPRWDRCAIISRPSIPRRLPRRRTRTPRRTAGPWTRRRPPHALRAAGATVAVSDALPAASSPPPSSLPGASAFFTGAVAYSPSRARRSSPAATRPAQLPGALRRRQLRVHRPILRKRVAWAAHAAGTCN